MSELSRVTFLPTSPLPTLKRRSSSRVCRRRAKSVPWAATLQTAEHVKEIERYLRNIAKADSPPYLDAMVYTLLKQPGAEATTPSARHNMHPFFIPVVKKENTNTVTGLLRWPTPPEEFPLPVVTCSQNDPCLTLVSPSTKSFVTRAIAEADYAGREAQRDDIRSSSVLAVGYQNGDVDKSGLGIERYLTVHTEGFPDIYEGLAQFHLAKGDESSALITCERAARAQAGWGRAHAFHAEILKGLGRELEARDAARFSLQLPLWTIGSVTRVRDMAVLAGYQEEESLRKIYRTLYEDKREKEIAEGKPSAQVALDRAAWLLDVCVAEKEWGGKGWEDIREQLAELYDEAGMNDLATFVRY